MALVRWFFVFVLTMHGIGHLIGFLAAWTTVPVGWQDAVWLFGRDVRVARK